MSIANQSPNFVKECKDFGKKNLKKFLAETGEFRKLQHESTKFNHAIIHLKSPARWIQISISKIRAGLLRRGLHVSWSIHVPRPHVHTSHLH